MIRQGRYEEIDAIAKIYATARQYMIDCGFEQWINGYPNADDVRNDIDNGHCYVLEDENGLYGAFALIDGMDPTYSYIEDGEWINDEEYLTLHRVASDGSHRGVFKEIADYAKARCNHLRVDTHKDNQHMQRVITNNGFTYRGIIYLVNGHPRQAYEYYGK